MTDYEHWKATGKVREGSCKPLTLASLPGDYVHWKFMTGNVQTAFLKEFDNGTAILIRSDGREQAVRVD